MKRNGEKLTLQKDGSVNGRYKWKTADDAIFVLLTLEEYDEFEKYRAFADVVVRRSRKSGGKCSTSMIYAR